MASISDIERAIVGGINSGRQRSINRGAVEHFPAIDLRVLRRAGLLSAGECTYTTLQWGNQAPEAISARIFIDLSDAEDASMRVVWSGDRGANTERVAIECIPAPYGGVRHFFLCPLTGIRCEQVFQVDGIFGSRKGHRLTYSSQSEDELSRSRRKVRKLHRQLDGDFRYARPRGRNRWRAVQRLRAAQHEAHLLYRECLRSLIDDVQ